MRQGSVSFARQKMKKDVRQVQQRLLGQVQTMARRLARLPLAVVSPSISLQICLSACNLLEGEAKEVWEV
jgi:hypothetical protein